MWGNRTVTPQQESIPEHPGVSAARILLRQMQSTIDHLSTQMQAIGELIGQPPNQSGTAPVPKIVSEPPVPAAADAPTGLPLEWLKSSIGNTGTRWLPPADRTGGAWDVLDGVPDSQLTGEHRWIAPNLPAWQSYAKAGTGERVVTIDRNASYFAACGSVMVSPSLLSHTGPLVPELAAKRGGFFRIDRFDWPMQFAHPLGQIAERDGDWWVTNPHLSVLIRLARKNVIDMPVVCESWSGLGKKDLFTEFSETVRRERQYLQTRTGDPEVANTSKRLCSIALRMMWSDDDTKSPIWRPDWSIAVRAEASVRHWGKAWTGREAGGQLLALETVDEAAWLAPADADWHWEPAGYSYGPGYGDVKQKANVTLVEWLKDRQKPGRSARAER